LARAGQVPAVAYGRAMNDPDPAPITAIDFVSATGYIAITRADDHQHGMFSTRAHARDLARMHGVALTVDGQLVPGQDLT
jgi:hypothetical protein